jgi:hypothetical protein
MAANTPVTINFQARDWEYLIGLTKNYDSDELQDAVTKLRVHYAGLAEKPQGSTVINIASTETVVIMLYQAFLAERTGASVTTNGQPYNRIRAAVLAMNNVLDNFILNTVTAVEDAYNNDQGTIRKRGRKFIMMITYDSN